VGVVRDPADSSGIERVSTDHASSLGTVPAGRSQWQIVLYDAGHFEPGHHFMVQVELADGTKRIARVRT
jgi:hypothetical protein